MKLRAVTLGGAALAAMLFAAPAYADVYATNPTPQERAETDRLNGAAAVRAQTDADANAAARAQYNANEAAVQRDRARYEADRARYDAERAAYERNRDRLARDGYGDARRWDVFFGASRFRDLGAMRSRDLVGLKVSTRGGARVGYIRDFDTNRYGRITRVAIGVGNGNLAWVDSDDLRFDPMTRVVFTTLSRDQIGTAARMRYPRF